MKKFLKWLKCVGFTFIYFSGLVLALLLGAFICEKLGMLGFAITFSIGIGTIIFLGNDEENQYE